jgi:hypothetical protein
MLLQLGGLGNCLGLCSLQYETPINFAETNKALCIQSD